MDDKELKLKMFLDRKWPGGFRTESAIERFLLRQIGCQIIRLYDLPERYTSRYDFVVKAVAYNSNELYSVEYPVDRNKHFLHDTLSYEATLDVSDTPSCPLMYNINSKWTRNKSFILKAFRNGYKEVFLNMDEKFKNDRDIILAMVTSPNKNNKFHLRIVPEIFREDKEIIMATFDTDVDRVEFFYNLAHYISPYLYEDEDIVSMVVDILNEATKTTDAFELWICRVLKSNLRFVISEKKMFYLIRKAECVTEKHCKVIISPSLRQLSCEYKRMQGYTTMVRSIIKKSLPPDVNKLIYSYILTC